ncbi:tripartite tricarboxylate transporter TctB family protein [Ramlibacter sp. G-1-2-2]|uniref:Tripartite tricarboxylate transporter TctB family protein n=2 Tax=Ramlibacter agri TaxID=2728837 RepID=A0A848HDK1_9BURK|nr:tripartite tricarboxylate transporter TctB family protein [Ramlibacter agri]NML47549.1 tripartite tricarboxylate transporter TctB family protein [Ramlibacter agri]
MAVSLAFGLSSLKYQMGDFSRAGPGLFPAMVSAVLLLVGVAIVVRSRFVKKVPIDLHFKNISVIIGSLCAFAVVSMFVNMIVGIVVMVFLATIAGTTYSWKRNVKISIGLVLMAFFFARVLGMNLPLY